MFPQRQGDVKFTHRWGGIIATSTRFCVVPGVKHNCRLAWAVGYTEQVLSTSIRFNNQRGKFSMDVTASMEDMWDMDFNLILAGDMLTEMSKGLASRPRLSSLEVKFTDPYMEYIGGKSTLTITARPNEPVAISQIKLYKPSDVPALLRLEATAH